MEYKKIVEKYLSLDKELRSRIAMYTDIIKILDRGYVCCNNDNIKGLPPTLLLTGLNPSFQKDKNPKPYSFQTAEGRYWKEKRDQFGELKDSIPYLDLFPIRESHQKEGFEKTFRNANDITARFLEITQQAIEDIAPKMIIHANRDSMYYWGIKKYGRGNDEKNPWMGYRVERITRYNTPDLPQCMTDEKLSIFPLYRIVGLIDSFKRINCLSITKTNLTYIMEYVMGYRNPKDKERFLYKPHEWLEISNWLNK